MPNVPETPAAAPTHASKLGFLGGSFDPVHKAHIAFALAAAIGGCSGKYQYTLGDQIGACGSEAVVVARVQRSEVWRFGLPAKYTPIRLKIDEVEGPERATYTDDLGYAGTTIMLPAKPLVHVSTSTLSW